MAFWYYENQINLSIILECKDGINTQWKRTEKRIGNCQKIINRQKRRTVKWLIECMNYFVSKDQ